MPFSRMIACARAMRCCRSSTPIGGTSPRMFLMAASSASAVEPPTPTVMGDPCFLMRSSPEPALDQDVCGGCQHQRCSHQDECHGRTERPVVELKLSVDQGTHHSELRAAEKDRCRIGVHTEDEGQDRSCNQARQ